MLGRVLATNLIAEKANRLKTQGEYSKELKRAESMAVVDLERGGVEGEFFPQVGTNLTTPGSVRKASSGTKKSAEKSVSSVKKSAQKSEQAQQTTPILELRRGVTLPGKPKTPPQSVGTMVDNILKKVSPKRLTEEAQAKYGNQFRNYVRNAQRGAAALGLSEVIDTHKTKRKLLNTPGGTPGLPA